MEIKITKKTIICVVAVIVLCIASFLAGRFIRFRRVSGASEQLISGIISAGTDTDKVIDSLTAAGYSAKSVSDYGQLISSIIGEMRTENEQLRVSADEAQRAIESNQRVTAIVDSAYSRLSSTTGTAIDQAIERAEEYERTIESLRQALGDTSENNEQPAK